MAAYCSFCNNESANGCVLCNPSFTPTQVIPCQRCKELEAQLDEIASALGSPSYAFHGTNEAHHKHILARAHLVNKLQDENERLREERLAFAIAHAELEAALHDLYFAGRWSLTDSDMSEEDQVALWQRVKDLTGWSVTGEDDVQT